MIGSQLRKMTSSSTTPLRFIDIAFNSTDDQFAGSYHGKQKHPADLPAVLARAKAAGVEQLLLTGGSLSESVIALEQAKSLGFRSTAGCHPTRVGEMDADPETYLQKLSEHIVKGKGSIVAVGECGLDYDRLKFSSRESQITHFTSQLTLSQIHNLPLFLHSRAAGDDFLSIMKAHRSLWKGQGGVVHSFTGTLEEMRGLVEEGLYVGINGCSLKTEENLEAVKELPLERLMLETDAPYCSITTSHASHKHLASLPSDLSALYGPATVKPEKFVEGKAVKGRNEPCSIGQVAWVVAKVKGMSMEEVCEAAYKNTRALFKLGDEVKDV